MTQNLAADAVRPLSLREIDAQIAALRYTNAVWDRLLVTLEEIAAEPINEGVTAFAEAAGLASAAVAL